MNQTLFILPYSRYKPRLGSGNTMLDMHKSSKLSEHFRHVLVFCAALLCCLALDRRTSRELN